MSEFKTRLDSVSIGETVEFLGPMGTFIYDPDKWRGKTVVLISEGIGITPFRSMIKFALSTSTDFDIRLVYSSRSLGKFVFKKELDDISGRDERLKLTYIATGEQKKTKETHREWIDAKSIRTAAGNLEDSIFYVCGPPSMVDSISIVLEKLSVPKDSVHREQFTGY